MNKKIIYLEILRIIACFLVLINHTNGVILNNPSFSNNLFYSLGFSICKIGVALFFMITGTLLLDKNFDLKKSFKSIYRVFVPLICLSLLLYVKDSGLSKFSIIYFLKDFVSKPSITAYWYIYSLIGLYLAVPFIQKMIKNFNNKDYILFSVIFLLFPSFINLLNDYLNLNIYNNIFMSFYPTIIGIMVCGYYISKLEYNKKHFICSLLIFFVSYIAMFSSVFVPYLLNNKISYTLDYWNCLPVILMAISLFYIIKCLLENKKITKKVEKMITILGSTTFGIYLIHALINFRIYNLNIFKILFSYNEIIATILLDIFVFIICFIVVYFLKKIPFIKKFI